MNKQQLTYRELDSQSIHINLLENFNRFQETKRVWFKENDQYKVKDDTFLEQWNDEKKREVIQSLLNCMELRGIVVGAFNNNELVGFSNIESELFGAQKEYVELPFIHVSHEARGSGIGKIMFALCCEKAKRLGAKKLYIAAHPSEETQHFYKAVGCEYASEANPKIVEREPLDIQLEFALYT
jgi:N-acetylglutamate synthase-like GNAT family acetyltransferase